MPIDDLTREFLIESQEGLDRMERCLTELETRPDDGALLAEIFRAVHTIKGTTGFLGFQRLEKLAHAGESLLGLLRDGVLAVEPHVVTVLLELLDGLRSILKCIETEGAEGEGVDAELELIARLDQMQRSASDTSLKEPAIAVRITRKHSPRSLGGSKLVSGPYRPKSSPPVSPPSQMNAPLTDGEPHATTGLSLGPDAAEPVSARTAPAAAQSTLRVDVAVLNRMMNLVGELVLTRNQILQATCGDGRMTMLSRRLDMVTADLRESVMKARMQPVSNVFSKIPRLVRDLSHDLHRQVQLQMEGQETELDKSLLEAVKDPLTHAVRNALDHGIEAPEVRAGVGKPATGTLLLRALQEGSHVLIEISDDGAGISVDKIRDKAIEQGLIAADRAAHMGERELLQLIFMPGFSTAERVTKVSGRGVGMDVVRTNVEKIGGKVEIDSRLGKGTTLRMRIPLTLAIVPALIVRSMQNSFALPQAALSELVHVAAGDSASTIEWIDNAPLYRLRGKLLPLVFLDRLLTHSGEGRNLSAQERFIAVLDADGRHFGLVVDGLADPEEIVVKPLSLALRGIAMYSGATVLGNGELALILDPGAIAQRAGIRMAGEDESVEASPAEGRSSATLAEFLLVEIASRRAAIPLEDVLRIEQATASRIEQLDHRPVLNFSGHLVPLEDSGNLIEEALLCPESNLIIVVCRFGSRQVGVVVSHVLDVASGSDLFEADSELRAGAVTLLKDRVTQILDLQSVSSLCMEALTSTWPQAQEALV